MNIVNSSELSMAIIIIIIIIIVLYKVLLTIYINAIPDFSNLE